MGCCFKNTCLCLRYFLIPFSAMINIILYTTRLQSDQTSLYSTIIFYKASIRSNLPLYHHYILQGFNQDKPPSIAPLYTTRLQSEQTSLYSTIIYYKASIRTNLHLYHHYILQGFNQNKPPSIAPLYTTGFNQIKPPSIPPLYTTRLQSEQTSLYTTIIYYKASIRTNLPLYHHYILQASIRSNLTLYHHYIQGFNQNKPPSIPPLYTTRLQSEQTSLYTTIIYYKASIRTNLPL